MTAKERAGLLLAQDPAVINTPTKGMDNIIMSATTDTSKNRADIVRQKIDVNLIVTANVRAALLEADHGPKWLSKQLGVSRTGAKFRLEGAIDWLVSDIMTIAQALKVPASRFFEGI